MLTSKERAALRARANTLPVILQVGKLGLSETLRQQLDGALTARELVKGGVLEHAPLTAKEAAQELAAQTGSEVVQVIGSKFVLYRKNPEKPAKDGQPRPAAEDEKSTVSRVGRPDAIRKAKPSGAKPRPAGATRTVKSKPTGAAATDDRGGRPYGNGKSKSGNAKPRTSGSRRPNTRKP